MKMKKTLLILLLFVVGVFSPTCKKISKYPIRMNGVWYAPNSGCGSTIMIDENGKGEHFSTEDADGCTNPRGKGKMKISKGHLYIGTTSFKFIVKPTLYSGNDSLILPGRFQTNNPSPLKGRITVKMTLQNTFLNSGITNEYFKIIEY